MKESLLQYLVCPACRAALSLQVEARNEREIERGTLHCQGCPCVYPIIKWIPRFTGSDSYAGSFSFQWTVHRQTQVDSLAGHEKSRKDFTDKTAFTESELKGGLALDVGCGTGRYMEIAASLGAEVIGFDLSYAVDAAFANMGRREGIHLVQADIFKMPFCHAVFDVVYSIGVLHHTPNTREAFGCLPALLKPGGMLAIWVYEWGGAYSVYLNRVRSLTVSIPKILLYGLCWVCVPLLHVMARLPWLWQFALRIPTSTQHRGLVWDVLDTFDLYSPRYRWNHTSAEVREWFEAVRLEKVEVLSHAVAVRGRWPRP